MKERNMLGGTSATQPSHPTLICPSLDDHQPGIGDWEAIGTVLGLH